MEATFEVAEQQSDGFDSLVVGQVLEPLFLNLMQGNAFVALLLGMQVQLFQFSVRKSQKFL
jgi:hypothetical protein